MRPIGLSLRWITATLCVAASADILYAQEGVVRISDAADQAGVVRMGAPSQTALRPVAFVAGPTLQSGYTGAGFPTAAMPGYAGPAPTWTPVSFGGYPGAMTPGCLGDGCLPQQIDGAGPCCSEGDCMSSCEFGGCPGAYCDTNCDECFYGPGHRARMVRLFAPAASPNECSGRYPKRCWRGQQMNYLARNRRLSNILFGWMVPSGCCGQGCPPVGCYKITYADQPGAQHPQDSGQAWGAQGYGVPVTVPLPPNVRHSYNYSWGIPASRVSHIGHYDPSGQPPQSVYHHSW